jgi:hypothetical protein
MDESDMEEPEIVYESESGIVFVDDVDDDEITETDVE